MSKNPKGPLKKTFFIISHWRYYDSNPWHLIVTFDAAEIFSILGFHISDCGSLPSPTDGSVALPPVTSEGQIVVYSCDLNFALSDLKLAIRTCLSTGLWSGSAPLCISGMSHLLCGKLFIEYKRMSVNNTKIEILFSLFKM